MNALRKKQRSLLRKWELLERNSPAFYTETLHKVKRSKGRSCMNAKRSEHRSLLLKWEVFGMKFSLLQLLSVTARPGGQSRLL